MITIYIDDSGTSNLNEPSQPITLFSAVCVNNKSLHSIEKSIRGLLSSMESDFNSILSDMIAEKKYEASKKEKIKKMILSKIMGEKFEFHCAELYRGDDAYMLLDKTKREEYIETMLKNVASDDISVITVYIDKAENKDKYKDVQDIQKKSEIDIVNRLIDEINKYLSEKKEQGFIIIDQGNKLVRKLLLPKMKKETYDNLSSEILEKDSNESLIIQLADTCAYTNNMKLTSDYKSKQGIRDKKKAASEKFSSITKENTILVNVVNNEKDNEIAS